MGDLSKHFSNSEFVCKCGKCEPSVSIDSSLIILLELLHTNISRLYGEPSRVEVTSGVRCKEHNDAEGGRPKSKHLLGIAADVKCFSRGFQIEPVDIHKIPDRIFPNTFGLLVYQNFNHIDVRVRRFR